MEKATIFLMFWVRAQIAVNRVVMALRHHVILGVCLCNVCVRACMLACVHM